MKPAFVLGSASCLYDDMALARDAFPGGAEVFGVNKVGYQIECDHIVTLHGELVFKFTRETKGSPKLHTKGRRRTDPVIDGEPDYVWEFPGGIHGTSTMLAVRIARAMGFYPVLMCGAPMSPVGYVDGYNSPRDEFDPDNPKSGVIESWRDGWRNAHKAGKLAGVYSASGWTRELLGWLPQPT